MQIGDRLWADMQGLGDLIRRPFGQQQLQHFKLPRAQDIGGHRLAAELAERELMIDIGTDGDAAGKHIHHRPHQRIGRARLRHITSGAGTDSLHREAGILVHGEHQDSRAAIPLADAPDRFNAADTGHAQIHDHEIRLDVLVEAIGVGAIGRFGDNPQSRLLLQDRSIALANDGMVVDQHDGAATTHAAYSSRVTPSGICSVWS